MSHWREPGPDQRHGHRLERGDLRYVILSLLEDRPSYGYELIRALEERFHGFYTPSPGTIYPTLQWLEDLGYVTAAEQDGRKVYTISEEGRRFLAARGPKLEEIWERMGSWWNPFDRVEFRDEMREFTHELRDMARELHHDARWASPEKLRRVRDIIAGAAHEIEGILRQPEPGPVAAGPAPASRPAADERPSGPQSDRPAPTDPAAEI